MLPSVGAVVLDDERRILVVRHANDGLWTLPGGCVEPDEDPEEAVVRELQEELGLAVRPRRVLAVCGGPECRVQYANGDEVSYVVALYACDAVGGNLAADGREVLEARYADAEDLLRLDFSTLGRTVLDRAFRELERHPER